MYEQTARAMEIAMRTFIGYRIIIVIVATSLFITTFGTIPVFANGYDDAKKDAEKKAAKAAPLVKECNELRAKAAAAKKKADDLRKAADKARDAADKAPKSEGGFLSDPATDKAAADAEDAADAAAKAADDAKDAADRNPNDKKAQKTRWTRRLRPVRQ